MNVSIILRAPSNYITAHKTGDPSKTAIKDKPSETNDCLRGLASTLLYVDFVGLHHLHSVTSNFRTSLCTPPEMRN